MKFSTMAGLLGLASFGCASPQPADAQAGPAPSVAGTWIPPVGIPAPPFGIAETAPALPSPWSTETPGFFYVAEAGSDERPYGTPQSPRASIPATLPAGSVLVLAGEYAVNHEVSPVRCLGTATAPVWIVGASRRPTVTRKWIVEGSYFVIENLDFAWPNASGNGKLLVGGDHIVVRHCDLRGDTATGVGGLYPFGQYLVLWDNRIHDFGDVRATSDQDNHGVSIGDGTSFVWIVDNEIARCSGDGVQINAGDASKQATTHHIYLGRNVSHDNKQTGLWTKQAVDVIFSQNEVYGHRPGNSSYGACVGFQYAPDRVWFLFNHLHDCEVGIGVSSNSGMGTGTESYYVGNVIHGIHSDRFDPENAWTGGGALMFAGGVDRYVVGNTIVDTDAGIDVPGAGSLLVADNLFARVGGGSHVYLQDPAVRTTFRANLADSSPRVRVGNQRSSASGFQNGDPRFVGPQDFRLGAGSPAIDAGTAEQVYARFRELYGLDIGVDFTGARRPSGPAWDIGAYEYVGGGR